MLLIGRGAWDNSFYRMLKQQTAKIGGDSQEVVFVNILYMTGFLGVLPTEKQLPAPMTIYLMYSKKS